MNLLLILALLAPPSLPITPEAQAIATCESGDTINLGTIDYTTVNVICEWYDLVVTCHIDDLMRTLEAMPTVALYGEVW